MQHIGAMAIFARLCKFIRGCRRKISTRKSASVYECVRFTWPKNRLRGSRTTITVFDVKLPRSRFFGQVIPTLLSLSLMTLRTNVSKKYESVTMVGVRDTPYATPFEHGNIYLLRGRRPSPPFNWADDRHYY